ncbi:hypothetical protein EV663_10779 [Rhodovulum bhavnagarense]|uniref:Cytochrome c domain-containing protein n=1 Tax=Rhodovulum bhavnagarense TaxID=992286 RepID=A0A4R2RED2_9RHOB|nr:hypothetical protein [Rhodovulum bhavnagarense]TCP60904.1 hypothetical protein EV663_10779 [Rhodovulum bhavnagarense]
MNRISFRPVFLAVASLIALTGTAPAGDYAAPLIGSYIGREVMPNPYAHIPAQCYIETAGGTQNPCQVCHTDGLANRRFGNNAPQGGASPFIGDLTAEYAFAALNHPFQPNGSINPWENTLFPEKLRAAVAEAGHDPAAWDMETWIRHDNWSVAAARRPGDARAWDSGVRDDPFRLFPALSPVDLPADEDGFVRSDREEGAFFNDGRGWITGWRSVNFVPHGIFTPLTGSVSGIYVRLPERFMQDAKGRFDLPTYAANLDLVAAAVSDHLPEDAPATYLGAAGGDPVQPGLYPIGTEFAHPLHYVDTEADGTEGAPGRFPGARADRVKEIRYMYKIKAFDPEYAGPEIKEESAPAYASRTEGWIDNGAGWILAGWIEDADGALRAQTPSELVQCVGCHSGHEPQRETGGHATFQSGVGVTIDSTWALPRRLPGDKGWGENTAMGYRAPEAEGEIGRSSWPDPINRAMENGEFAHFLEHVVGVSLYGDMPASVEEFLAQTIRTENGYSADWPALVTDTAQGYVGAQEQRAALLKEVTARGDHLDADGNLAGALLYPTHSAALAAARGYRMVVTTQRYDFGKDVFGETPVTFRYFREDATAFTHQDGTPYRVGEIVTDRPIDENRASLTWGVGIAATEITESPDYQPILDYLSGAE